ncbi:MAG: alkylmercury lyase family protein [Thermoplasmata archaeon]|nr:alkylmercury lyase family protein [Thermoplasmata archaeon]
MIATAQSDAELRRYIYARFLEEGSPPVVERMIDELHQEREVIEHTLERLDSGRQIKLLPGTHRILMAFPFSAIVTPHRVVTADGRAFFANCAWDALGFHTMLREPVQVDSRCFHCGASIRIGLIDGAPVRPTEDPPLVHLGLPAALWWDDIITTCSNTMVFFASAEHRTAWREAHPHAEGEDVPIEVMLRLSEPLYGKRLELGFARPSHDELVDLFRHVGLTSEFWRI